MAYDSYRYTSPKDPSEETQTLVVGTLENGDPKAMVLGGDPVELTEAEHAAASVRYNLRKVSEKQVEESQSGGEQQAPAEDDPQAGNAGAVSPSTQTNDSTTARRQR